MPVFRVLVTSIATVGALIASPALTAEAATPHAVKPASACPQPQTIWDTSSGGATNIRFAGTPIFHDGPGGTMTVTKSYSGTAKWSGTLSVEGDISDILASAKVSISTTLETSNTTTSTNQYSHTITKGKYGNAEYDSTGYTVNWKKYQQNHDCSLTLLDSGTVKLPTSKEGWRYWETSS